MTTTLTSATPPLVSTNEFVVQAKRTDGGGYRSISASDALPFLTPEVIEQHLAMASTAGEFAAIQAFRAWLLALAQRRSS